MKPKGYYILEWVAPSYKEVQFRSVRGRKAELHPEIEAFIYRDKHGIYHCTEGRTGFAISRGDTFSEAWNEARRLTATQEQRDEVQSLMEEAIAQFGISPRYTEGKEHDYAPAPVSQKPKRRNSSYSDS